MKPITKKIIITGQLITLAIYIIIYLVGTFCLWEFRNPFQWIIDIPTYSNDSRFGILFGFVTYYTMLYCFVAGHYFQKEKAEREKVEDLENGNLLELVLFIKHHGFRFTSGKWSAPKILEEMDSRELIEYFKKDTTPLY